MAISEVLFGAALPGSLVGYNDKYDGWTVLSNHYNKSFFSNILYYRFCVKSLTYFISIKISTNQRKVLYGIK